MHGLLSYAQPPLNTTTNTQRHLWPVFVVTAQTVNRPWYLGAMSVDPNLSALGSAPRTDIPALRCVRRPALTAFHSRLEVLQRYLLANSICESLDGEARNTACAELIKEISQAIRRHNRAGAYSPRNRAS